jgi:hypothetical protein
MNPRCMRSITRDKRFSDGWCAMGRGWSPIPIGICLCAGSVYPRYTGAPDIQWRTIRSDHQRRRDYRRRRLGCR